MWSITLLLKVWSEDKNWTSSKVIPVAVKPEALFYHPKLFASVTLIYGK